MALLGLGYAQVAQSERDAAAAGYETVTVVNGDTLWHIAASRYPNSDVREKVFEIEQLNRMNGPAIQAGQRLKVPRR